LALRGAAELASDEALQGYLSAPAEVAAWVLDQAPPARPFRDASLIAAQQGRLDSLRMAMRHGFRFDFSDCLSAACAALDPNLDALH